MKNHLTTALLVASLLLSGCASVNTAHIPPEGSAERNAILQAVHDALARQGRKNLVLSVPYLKVHNGWAWIQVNPRSADALSDRQSLNKKSCLRKIIMCFYQQVTSEAASRTVALKTIEG